MKMNAVVALLPDKRKITYVRFLNLLKGFADSNGILLNPPKIIIDFEAGMKEAITEVFPQSTLLGCFFHFNKCLFRHISNEGLITMHRDDGHFKTIYGRIKGLPFLPLDQVDAAFAEICFELEVYELEKVTNFVQYVERQWVSNTSVFPREIWSHAENFDPRTTNCVEGWHNKLNRAVRNHPDIFTLISTLQKFNEREEFDFRQMKWGRKIKINNSTYEKLEKKISGLRNKFRLNEISRNDFLDALSHCLA